MRSIFEDIKASLQSASVLAQMQARVWMAQVQSGRWVEQTRGLAKPPGEGNKQVSGYVLHPCLIDHQPTLIHATDLAERDPVFYQQLQAFAHSHRYQLLADRRHRDSDFASERRSRLLPVLVLSLGAGLATANEESSAIEKTLGLFDTQPLASLHQHNDSDVSEHLVSDTVLTKEDSVQTGDMVSAEYENVLEILRAHFQVEAADPAYVQQDLEAMADYFARFPQAVSLLQSLSGHPWQLRYSKDTFETQVRGTRLQVKGATVHFDSRAAAQLRKHKACVGEQRGACIASPADALLHELLHVESALLDSHTFIEQGGLSSVVYPFAHERSVISRENQLYRAMSDQDGSYRPSRRHHSGSLVASSCVTCLN